MDHVETYPDAYIWYNASAMVLNVDSDAAYLVLPNAKSQIVGFFQLADKYCNSQPPPTNGPLLVECKTINTSC